MVTTTLSSPHGAVAVLQRDPAQPLVAVSLRVAAGSRHEAPGHSGLAHLVEHLMFARTRRHARGGHHRLIQSLGGYVNAKTSADWTVYLHGVTPDLLDLVLDLERERFADAAVMFAPEDLGAERDIVLSERRQRMDSDPFGRAIEHLTAAVYPAGSAYHRLPVGWPDDLAGLTVEECRDFHDRHYVAPAVRLALVGDFDPDRVAGSVAGLLEVFAPGEPAGVPPPQPVLRRTERRVVTNAPRPRVYLGMPLPPEGSWEFELARFASFYLGRGIGASLPEQLIRRRRVAAGVTVTTMGRARGSSLGVIQLVPGGGVDPLDLVTACDEVLSGLLDGGVPQGDLDRARAVYRSARLADEDSFMRRGDDLSLSLVLGGPPRQRLEYDARVDDLTPGDLGAALADWYQPERRAELVYR